MADIRPKDLLPTTEGPADDDYLLLDGETTGTRKILASHLSGGDILAVEKFLTNTDGSVNQATQLQAAFSEAAATGKPLYFPTNVVARTDNIIEVLAGNLTVYGGGTIVVPASNTEALRYAPAPGTVHTVSAIAAAEWPSGTTQTVSRMTLASGANTYAVGDVVFINSADEYTVSGNHKKAELMQVLGIDAGNQFIYLAGELADSYTASVQLRKLSPSRLDIRGLRFAFNGDALTQTTAMGRGALIVERCVNARVDVTFDRLAAVGLRVVSSWKPRCRVVANWLRNSGQGLPQYLGYGVTASNATRGGFFEVHANGGRHAYTTNMYDRGGTGFEFWDHGAPRENIATGTAHNPTSAAWDTHAGTFDQVFQDCWTYISASNREETGAEPNHIQDRSCDTRIIGGGCIAKGTDKPLMRLIGQSVNHGKANRTLVSNVLLENRSSAEAPSPLVFATRSDAQDGSITFHNLTVIGTHIIFMPTGGADVTFHNPEFVNLGGLRSGSTKVKIFGGRRVGNNNEPYNPQVGGTIELVNHHVEGTYSSGNVAVRASNTSGVATLRHRNVTLGDSVNFIANSTSGSGSMTVVDIPVGVTP